MDAYYVVDESRLIVEVSGSYCDLIGYSPQDLLGRPGIWGWEGIQDTEMPEGAGVGCLVCRCGSKIQAETLTLRPRQLNGRALVLVRRSKSTAPLGEVAAELAHEINNSLSVLKGFTELLSEGLTRGPQSETLGPLVAHQRKAIDRIALTVRGMKAHFLELP